MKNWSLSQKIWGVLMILCTAYVGNNIYATKGMLGLKNELNEITGAVVRRDQLTSEIKDNQRRMTVDTLMSILEEDPKKLEVITKRFEEDISQQMKSMAEYDSIANEKGKALLAEYKKAYENYVIITRKTVEYGAVNKNKEATETILSADHERAILSKHLDEMNDLTAAELKERSAQANATANNTVLYSIIGAIAAILAALSIAFLVLRSLTKTIAGIVTNLFENSEQVSAAAGQIAASSQTLSEASTEQAASLEETAAAIEELNAMVNKNSENANSTASTSEKSQDQANQGKQVIEKMIGSMGNISQSNEMIIQQINRSNESMTGIIKVIEEIGSKTKVINDIVFQTKLLSFNASVEAARAGEQGKGFAVVAQEVGNLAQMSGNASKEISQLLDESIQKVHAIVSETKSSVEKLIVEGKETVEGGTQVAHECGDVLEEIVKNVSSVSSMAGEIATASQEQSRGVNEITKAMSQLDQTTQQNAATSQQCASAAEQLSGQSHSLRDSVELLMLTVNGRKAGEKENPPQVAQPKKKTASNVVHLKPKKQSAPVVSEEPKPVFKKAAGGEVPRYDDEGFNDV